MSGLAGRPGRPPASRARFLAGTALGALAATACTTRAPAPPVPARSEDPAYAGSSACRECHPAVFRAWSGSHHALAERGVDAALDRDAFEPPVRVRHGSQSSDLGVGGERPRLLTRGASGAREAFDLVGVLGVEPLRQYLVETAGGRLQVTELAFDPTRREWFDVFGEEDRQPGEWGHWTGRGMSWNAMCAACHNTGVRKGYCASADDYDTRVVERGVGCEACHGPSAEHAAQKERGGRAADPTTPRLAAVRVMDACGTCHSRRWDLTGTFEPGAPFLDHYAPTIPDESETYYADGQVREEDYEYVSFLGTGMAAAGVACVDCHEPHGAGLRADGNALCLRCHDARSSAAPRIDAASHPRHRPDTPGGRCVDCHMPTTTYMQRDARHDHGFGSPDPWLTLRHGIPNACSRCHRDRGARWALAAVERWYPASSRRLALRERADRIARARAGDPTAVPALLRSSEAKAPAVWRATATALLADWTHDPAVARALIARADDPEPLVRAFAVRGLGPLASLPQVQAVLRERLADPVRFVRIEAAWGLRASVDPAWGAGADLLRELEENADRPWGAFRRGVYHLDRGEVQPAVDQFRRAVAWDPGTPLFREALEAASRRPHR